MKIDNDKLKLLLVLGLFFSILSFFALAFLPFSLLCIILGIKNAWRSKNIWRTLLVLALMFSSISAFRAIFILPYYIKAYPSIVKSQIEVDKYIQERREETIREVMVSKMDLKKGTFVSSNSFNAVEVPINAQYDKYVLKGELNQVMGKILLMDISKNQILTWDHIKE